MIGIPLYMIPSLMHHISRNIRLMASIINNSPNYTWWVVSLQSFIYACIMLSKCTIWWVTPDIGPCCTQLFIVSGKLQQQYFVSLTLKISLFVFVRINVVFQSQLFAVRNYSSSAWNCSISSFFFFLADYVLISQSR